MWSRYTHFNKKNKEWKTVAWLAYFYVLFLSRESAKSNDLDTHTHTCKMIISVSSIINIHIYALFVFEIDLECHIVAVASSSLHFEHWSIVHRNATQHNKRANAISVQIIFHHFTFWHGFAMSYLQTNIKHSTKWYVCKFALGHIQIFDFDLANNGYQ